MEINYDKMGYCCNCHKNIGIWREDGKLIGFKDKCDGEFILSSKSKLHVALCESCFKSEIKLSDIMMSVIAGWEKELEMAEIEEEKKQAYRDHYYVQTILERVL